MAPDQLSRYTKQIQDWIATCSHNHVVRCNQPGSSILPKRLIFFDNIRNVHRLIQLEDDKDYKYVALSYCWGQAGNFKTTPDNLGQMELEIPYDRLPKTLQDVFTLVRQLDYCYLWIDALCIVQADHGAEWRTEAGKMGDVYANADLVIGAMASESVHDGLFVNFEEYSPAEKTEFHRIMRTCRTMTQKQWHYGIKAKYPLLCRGWAFQERLIARRIVHFTVLELIWECMEDRWCECGDEGKERLSGKINNLNAALKECRFDPSPVKHRLMWHECVQSFSKRDLTEADDRTFAIAGIASYLRQLDPATNPYVHGIWKDFLPWDLIWYCDQTSELAMDKPRGPSYSWISVDCGIEYPACPPTCDLDDRFSIAISTGTCLESHFKDTSATTPTKCFRAVTEMREHWPNNDARNASDERTDAETSHRLNIISSLSPVTIQRQLKPQSSWWGGFTTLLASMVSCFRPRKLQKPAWQRPDSAQTWWRVCESGNGQSLPFWPDINLGGESKIGNASYYYVRVASVEDKEGIQEVGMIVRGVGSGDPKEEEEELYERVGLAGNMSCDLERMARPFGSRQETREVVMV